MEFKEKIILITGASDGIGKQLAIDLSMRGAVIIASGRSPARLEAVLTEIRRASPRSVSIRCDVGSRPEVHQMIGNVLAQFSGIDILINNAGIGMRKPFVETPLETIEELMRTNYLGTVYCTYEVLPSMLARGRGHIVNISSVAGHIGSLNMAGYCASKFAINGFSESLYHELKPRGIAISVVCPGPVKTAFNRSFAQNSPKSPKSFIISPESVSQTVMTIIEKKRFETITPRSFALICGVKRFMPGLFRAVSSRLFRSHVLPREKAVT
jgi:short-subunit dehydrogenase